MYTISVLIATHALLDFSELVRCAAVCVLHLRRRLEVPFGAAALYCNH